MSGPFERVEFWEPGPREEAGDRRPRMLNALLAETRDEPPGLRPHHAFLSHADPAALWAHPKAQG